MNRASLILLLLGISFQFLSCSGDNEINENDSENSAIDSSFCFCDELIFDQQYNHYYRFVKREGFTGSCETNYPNGNLKQSKKFLKGKLDGKMLTYYENGSLQEEMEFMTNFQTGNHVKYNEQGDTLFYAIFKRGNLLEVVIE